MEGGPALSRASADAVVATKTAPRVTKESIEAKIAKIDFLHVGETMTICVLTMRNGWTQVGTSASAAAANFDREVGQRYAYDDAFKPLWALEGYLLKTKLDEAERVYGGTHETAMAEVEQAGLERALAGADFDPSSRAFRDSGEN